MTDIRDIQSIPLARSHIDALIKHGFRFVADFHGLTPIELAKECQLPLKDSVTILEAIKASEFSLVSREDSQNVLSSSLSTAVTSQDLQANNIFTAKEFIQKMGILRPIITFCKEIDVMLGGGIPIGQITEVCGVPGIGKTQLGMQLALNVQIPEVFQGSEGKCIYIDTEGSFLPERVYDIAKELSNHLKRLANHNFQRQQQQNQSFSSLSALSGPNLSSSAAPASETTQQQLHLSENVLTPEYFLSNIDLFRCHSQSELTAVLFQLKERLSSSQSSSSSSAGDQRRVKLIVIDSIAFPFRTQVADLFQRNLLLNQLLQLLNEIAYNERVAVVLVNHMTTKIIKMPSSEESSSSSSHSIPWKDRSLFFQQGERMHFSSFSLFLFSPPSLLLLLLIIITMLFFSKTTPPSFLLLFINWFRHSANSFPTESQIVFFSTTRGVQEEGVQEEEEEVVVVVAVTLITTLVSRERPR
jgi:RAD51-like protein 2